MKTYGLEIVVTHKMRYKADCLENAIKCAEFDFLNEDCLWLCDEMISNWDVEYTDWNKQLKRKNLPVRHMSEYDLGELL